MKTATFYRRQLSLLTTPFGRGAFASRSKWILLTFAVVLSAVSGWCNSITIGLPAGSRDTAPFARRPSGPPADRYQEAYASVDFTNLGPITISSISFLDGNGGDFASGTYSLYLSTITSNINSLSDTAFDSNPGANNILFTNIYLSGASPVTLTFNGTPFTYDPSAGNLLLDIKITPDSPATLRALAAYDSNHNATGTFSQYDNFGPAIPGHEGEIGFGLVTRFGYTPVPEPSIASLMCFTIFVTIFFRRSSNKVSTKPR